MGVELVYGDGLMTCPTAKKVTVFHERIADTGLDAINLMVEWCQENGTGRYALDHWFASQFDDRGVSHIYFSDADTAFWFKVRFG